MNDARPDAAGPAPSDPAPGAVDRRRFLGSASTLAMAGGLAAGYGTFVVLIGEYLYPPADEGVWYFVTRAAALVPGESLAFESPEGVMVVVKREPPSADGERGDDAGQFQALSSICPHLGCRVHWEPHNNRFFCPCHNGEFDPEGRPTGGPPKAGNQHLERYPLKLEAGLLYLRLPSQTIDTRSISRRPPAATTIAVASTATSHVDEQPATRSNGEASA